MKHRKKNLALAKDIFSPPAQMRQTKNFLTDRLLLHTKRVQNCVTMSHGYFYHESHMLRLPCYIYIEHFEFSPGIRKYHINSLGPSRETYKETTRTKTSSFGELK